MGIFVESQILRMSSSVILRLTLGYGCVSRLLLGRLFLHIVCHGGRVTRRSFLLAGHLLFPDNLGNPLLSIRYVLVLLHELGLADNSVFVLNLLLLLAGNMMVSFVM